MKAYIRALRAPFLAGSLIPVILGAAYGFSQKILSLHLFLIAFLGVAFLHLGANLINDYYDAGGSDPINVRLTPFSGGSRVIQDGKISSGLILLMALAFFVLGSGAGIWLVYLKRPLVIPIGLFGLLAGWAYSAPPLQLMSRGWGEILIFFAFGPFITLGTYYVMSGSFTWPAFALGIPQGLFIAGVIWINQFPDYQADHDAAKRNLVVRLGPSVARYVYSAIILLAFVMVIFLIPVFGFSYLIMLSFVALPLALKAIKVLWHEYLSHKEIIPAQALTIQTLIGHGLVVSLGLGLCRAC